MDFKFDRYIKFSVGELEPEAGQFQREPEPVKNPKNDSQEPGVGSPSIDSRNLIEFNPYDSVI